MKHWEEEHRTCECIVRVPQTQLLALATLHDTQQEGNCDVSGRNSAVICEITDSSDGAGN